MKQIFKLHDQAVSKKKVRKAKDVFDNIKEIDIDYDQENFLVFFLDVRCKLLKCEVLFKGAINECIIDPKIIFKTALLSKATAMIVAHNHPSDGLEPSLADIETLGELKKAGRFLDINILDSVIFNQKEYYSMAEGGDL